MMFSKTVRMTNDLTAVPRSKLAKMLSLRESIFSLLLPLYCCFCVLLLTSLDRITELTSLAEYDWIVKRKPMNVVIVFTNGNKYEGQVANKVPHGKGSFFWSDGTFYEGEFEDGFPRGKGSINLPDMSEYVGTLYNGYFHGEGIYNLRSTSLLYSGGWKYGKKCGKAWLLYEPGAWYEGEFLNDFRHGYGYRQYGDGASYEGFWAYNMKDGEGSMRWPNNDIYVGNWTEGVIDGYGEYGWRSPFDKTFTFSVMNHYKGGWVDGRRKGAGLLYFGMENGAKMAGMFENDFKHGAAIIVCGNGRTIERNPLFDCDKPIHLSANDGEPTCYSEDSLVRKSSYKEILNKIRSREPINSVISEKCKNENVACNPIEIQLNSAPDDIELTFYVERVLSMYATMFDTIMFDLDTYSTSSEVSESKHQSSKWNLAMLNGDTRVVKSPQLDQMVLSRRNSKNMNSNTYLYTMRQEEKYIRYAITRNLPRLMDIYYHYATLMSPTKVYFKHYLVRLFLWQLYLDIGITNEGISLVEIDLFLEENVSSAVESSHHPFEHIYFFQFIQSLIGTALLVHSKKREFSFSGGLLAYVFENFLNTYLFPKAGQHKGRSLFEFKDLLPMKNVYEMYFELGEPHTARQFLNYTCTKRGEEPPCFKSFLENENCSKPVYGKNVNVMGQNIIFVPDITECGTVPLKVPDDFKDFDPFYRDLSTFRILGPRIVLECLCNICPCIMKSGVICNINYPLTFLEFYEVLILCSLTAMIKVKKAAELLRVEEVNPEEGNELDKVSTATKEKKAAGKAKAKKK